MPEALLAGERGGRKIEGFDLGNSPLECAPEILNRRPLVLTTSNGTPLLLASRDAALVFTSSLLNREAVAEICLRQGRDVVIACAGSGGGRSSVEDVVCAGAMVHYLLSAREDIVLRDGAHIAWAMFEKWRHRLQHLLEHSAAGQNLKTLDYAQDVKLCAELDSLPVVPHYLDGKVALFNQAQ
jgi:2-phosphosulfolactate phosphatase